MNDSAKFSQPTEEDVGSALAALPLIMSRPEWFSILCAVKSENSGWRHLVEGWSQQSKEYYNEKTFEAAWNSVKSNGGVTIKTLFKMARDNGWKPEREKKREAWKTNEHPPGTKKFSIGRHKYHDLDGNLTYFKTRYNFKNANGETVLLYKDGLPEGNKPHKTFDFGHVNPNTGRDNLGMGGAAHVLYNLPNTYRAFIDGEVIYAAEGETKVDKLVSWGLPAICSDGGSGSWKPEQLAKFKGAHIIYIVDNDAAGERDAKKFLLVAAQLEIKAWIIRLPRLKNYKDDLIQWDGDKAELLALVDAAVTAKPNGEEPPPVSKELIKSGLYDIDWRERRKGGDPAPSMENASPPMV
jgi:hypothetical protein